MVRLSLENMKRLTEGKDSRAATATLKAGLAVAYNDQPVCVGFCTISNRRNISRLYNVFQLNDAFNETGRST